MGRSLTYAPDLVATARRAFGHGTLESPTRTARADNPLCGDEIELDVRHDGAQVEAIAHRARGCSFTHASASVLAQVVPGMSLAVAHELAVRLRRELAGTKPLPEEVVLLSGVRIYPARVRCALLPWEALLSALGEV